MKGRAMQVQESSNVVTAVTPVTPVTSEQYKRTLAHWSTGVTVLATLVDGLDLGITASSFTSLSIEPPQVLVSVTKRLYTHDALVKSGIFAVNILREEQVEWGKRFAGMIPEIEDRFQGIAIQRAATGCAIFSDALGWVDCRVMRIYDGDDHSIFVGEVLAAGSQEAGNPLLYYHRNWRGLGGQVVG